VEAEFKNVRALKLGEYDFTGPKGEKYPYIVIFDEQSNDNLTISLDKDCTPPAVEFGTLVDIWLRVSPNEKIVRGEERDRAISTLKLRAIDVKLSKSQAKPLAAAA